MANEKRLIDANKAQAVLVNMAEHLMEAGNPEMAGAVGYAAEVIGKQRTVAAVEVVHARWKNGHCTNCKQKAEVQSIGFNCTGGTRVDYKETNYCPNCGAKMDGERREGE